MARQRRTPARRPGPARRLPALLTAAVLALTGALASGAPASAASGAHLAGTVQIAPGVQFGTFQTKTPRGAARGDLLTVDLRNPHVDTDLLHPAAVAARGTVSAMANGQHAVAGVNGDFFNISETHAGVPATGSSSGPEIAGGQDLKAAVLDGQRFGPALPPGTSARDVLGVGTDHTGRLAGCR